MGINTNVYVSSVGYDALTKWAATTAYTLGQYRQPLTLQSYGNEQVFKCTTAGTSGGSEPSWSRSDGNTTTDGTVTWTAIGGRETEQLAGNWTAPLRTLQGAQNFARNDGQGDDYEWFVSSDHVEHDQGNGVGLDNMNCNVTSVSRTGTTLPPTDADYTPGATVQSSDNENLYVDAGFYKGVTFIAGTGGTNRSSVQLSGNNPRLALEDCKLVLNNTNSSAVIEFAAGTATLYMKNTTVKFSTTSQCCSISNAFFEWVDTPAAIDPTGATPTYLFNNLSGDITARYRFEGLDLTNVGTGLFDNGGGSNLGGGDIDIINCILDPTKTLWGGFGQNQIAMTNSLAYSNVNVINSDSSATFGFVKSNGIGSITAKGDITYAGSASDGTSQFSHTGIPSYRYSGVDSWGGLLEGAWISKYLKADTIGSPITISVEAIWFGPVAPSTRDIWLEADVLATIGTTRSTRATSRKRSLFTQPGTDWPSSASNWTGAVPLRQNSHAYVVGQPMKVVSNPGNIFMCSSNLTSGGSEPVGLATAVPGSLTQDGGSGYWICGWPITLSLTVTPTVVGVLKARVVTWPGPQTAGRVGQPSNTLSFVYDPKLTIT